MKILFLCLQLILAVLLAPLVNGMITRMKNNLRMRRGAPVLQPYYNLAKLFFKDEVVSRTASWIFRVTPFILFASSATVLVLTPMVISANPAYFAGDILAIIFILALGRFFLSLAGLDAGSAFGGMGSSREMFISSIAEPAACLAVFSLMLNRASTNPELIAAFGYPHLGTICAVLCLLMITLAETSRLPVDNQETHLELTMIHEAMVLEYSGRSLALIEMSSYIKQLFWFSLLSYLIFPVTVDISAGFVQAGLAAFLFLAKIIILAVIVSIIEVSVAKMRLFRVVDYFGFAIVLGIMAVVSSFTGL
jgi:formate hydrogenlyase subunit 4